MNYHFHDDASADARGTLHEHCRVARSAGIRRLCVTNHVEIADGRGGWTVRWEEAARRFRGELEAVEEARRRWPDLELRLGAEFEYRPEWAGDLERLSRAVPLDFVVGAIHDVDGLNVSGGRDVEAYFGPRTEEEAYVPYFEAVAEMVEWGRFDVVGHFDLVKRYGHDHFGAYEPESYEDVIRRVLRRMAAGGIGIEINTSGVAQAPGSPFPEPEILRWAREAGVPHLTLGSDSHAPERFTQGLAEGRALAAATGWTRLTAFREREPEPFPVAEAS